MGENKRVEQGRVDPHQQIWIGCHIPAGAGAPARPCRTLRNRASHPVVDRIDPGRLPQHSPGPSKKDILDHPHGAQVAAERIFLESAVLGNTLSDSGVGELHQDSPQPAQSEDPFPVHLPYQAVGTEKSAFR